MHTALPDMLRKSTDFEGTDETTSPGGRKGSSSPTIDAPDQ